MLNGDSLIAGGGFRDTAVVVGHSVGDVRGQGPLSVPLKRLHPPLDDAFRLLEGCRGDVRRPTGRPAR